MTGSENTMNQPDAASTGMPRFSIVIPAYNAARFLRETVKSVQAQTAADWELIIVDDGSTDDTARLCAELAEGDARIHCITTPNGGMAAARNLGLAASNPQTPFLAFLDSDDLWQPEFLSLLQRVLDAMPDAVAAHGRSFYIDAQGNRTQPSGGASQNPPRRVMVGAFRARTLRPDEPTTLECLLTSCNIASPGSVLIRRDAYARTDGFLSELLMAADWQLYLQITRQGPLAYVDQDLFGYRRHDSNSSNDQSSLRKEMFAVRHMVMQSPLYTPWQRRIARRGFRRSEYDTAMAKLRYAREDLLRGFFGGAITQTRYFAGHLLRSLRGTP